MKKLLYKISRGYSILPHYVAINITNKCNRSCSFCPYHGDNLPDNYHNKWYSAQPKMIDYDRLIKFFDRVPKFVIKQVAITGKGETTSHPKFVDLCEYFENRKIKFSVTTNGDRMNHRLAEKLKSYKYCTVSVSIYDDVQIETWITKDTFKTKGKWVYFNMTGKDVPHTDKGYVSSQYGIKYEGALRNFNISDFCKTPFSFLTINTDGSVVPCYSYNDCATIEDSVWKVFNGKLIRKYRRTAVNGRDCELADCNNCGVNMYD